MAPSDGVVRVVVTAEFSDELMRRVRETFTLRAEILGDGRFAGWPPPAIPERLNDPDEYFLPDAATEHAHVRVAPALEIEAFVRALAELDNQSIDVRAPDNAVEELTALARRGDEAGFRALAACLMPLEDVAACWVGCRARLGLPPEAAA